MGDLIVGALAVIGGLTLTGFAVLAAIVGLKTRSRKQGGPAVTALLLPWLALIAVGLDLTRQALTATGEIAPDWDADPAAELALLTVPQITDRLPVADALELIRAGIDASRSRRWNPWKH